MAMFCFFSRCHQRVRFYTANSWRFFFFFFVLGICQRVLLLSVLINLLREQEKVLERHGEVLLFSYAFHL